MKKSEYYADTLRKIYNKYRNYIDKYSSMYNVPREYIVSIIMKESMGNPAARGGLGEIGLMQILPSTARYLGYEPSELINNPEKQIEASTLYFSRLLNQFDNDYSYALLGYNAGPGRAGRLKKSGRGADTTYTRDVLNYANIAKQVLSTPPVQEKKKEVQSPDIWEIIKNFVATVLDAGSKMAESVRFGAKNRFAGGFGDIVYPPEWQPSLPSQQNKNKQSPGLVPRQALPSMKELERRYIKK
ncbi:MAG: hypothetical protein KatS3mg083_127 [Candidatus Dojkabacteria bacterium]|nr:MAG: hypothetical protein KatS3mg083_127 [Candidatus Dojkabacteria bacterium]